MKSSLALSTTRGTLSLQAITHAYIQKCTNHPQQNIHTQHAIIQQQIQTWLLLFLQAVKITPAGFGTETLNSAGGWIEILQLLGLTFTIYRKIQSVTCSHTASLSKETDRNMFSQSRKTNKQ